MNVMKEVTTALSILEEVCFFKPFYSCHTVRAFVFGCGSKFGLSLGGSNIHPVFEEKENAN